MTADIDVVPKHRSHAWLWVVLAIIVIALIIWAIAGHSHTTTRLPRAHPGVLAHMTVTGLPAPVA